MAPKKAPPPGPSSKVDPPKKTPAKQTATKKAAEVKKRYELGPSIFSAGRRTPAQQEQDKIQAAKQNATREREAARQAEIRKLKIAADEERGYEYGDPTVHGGTPRKCWSEGSKWMHDSMNDAELAEYGESQKKMKLAIANGEWPWAPGSSPPGALSAPSASGSGKKPAAKPPTGAGQKVKQPEAGDNGDDDTAPPIVKPGRKPKVDAEDPVKPSQKKPQVEDKKNGDDPSKPSEDKPPRKTTAKKPPVFKKKPLAEKPKEVDSDPDKASQEKSPKKPTLFKKESAKKPSGENVKSKVPPTKKKPGPKEKVQKPDTETTGTKGVARPVRRRVLRSGTSSRESTPFMKKFFNTIENAGIDDEESDAAGTEAAKKKTPPPKPAKQKTPPKAKTPSKDLSLPESKSPRGKKKPKDDAFTPTPPTTGGFVHAPAVMPPSAHDSKGKRRPSGTVHKLDGDHSDGDDDSDDAGGPAAKKPGNSKGRKGKDGSKGKIPPSSSGKHPKDGKQSKRETDERDTPDSTSSPRRSTRLSPSSDGSSSSTKRKSEDYEPGGQASRPAKKAKKEAPSKKRKSVEDDREDDKKRRSPRLSERGSEDGEIVEAVTKVNSKTRPAAAKKTSSKTTAKTSSRPAAKPSSRPAIKPATQQPKKPAAAAASGPAPSSGKAAMPKPLYDNKKIGRIPKAPQLPAPYWPIRGPDGRLEWPNRPPSPPVEYKRGRTRQR